MLKHHAQTTALNAGVFTVDTEHPKPLADASHLIVENGRAAYVDTGVNNSVPYLIDALLQQDLDVGDVEYVFLTHVHLDHAGGAGQLMKRLPNASCVVHPRGAQHMIDPSKLIAGTETVYGKERTREFYGVIEPIDANRIVSPEDEQWFDLNGRAVQTIYTEGHARHHYVLNDPQSKGVFTGDSFGVSYRELDTANGEIIFPTSTPVQFDPPEAHKAVDRIMACEPEQVYLTHFSRVRSLERLASEMHDGIDAYVAIARQHADDEERDQVLRDSIFEYYVERLRQHGYTGDRDTMWSVLSLDVSLNAQGLAVWLDKRQ